MNAGNAKPLGRRWTAMELRKLPPAQRDAVIEAAAALAEEGSPAAADVASGNAGASVVRRTQDSPARGGQTRAGITNGQIVKEGVRDLNEQE